MATSGTLTRLLFGFGTFSSYKNNFGLRISVSFYSFLTAGCICVTLL